MATSHSTSDETLANRIDAFLQAFAKLFSADVFEQHRYSMLQTTLGREGGASAAPLLEAKSELWGARHALAAAGNELAQALADAGHDPSGVLRVVYHMQPRCYDMDELRTLRPTLTVELERLKLQQPQQKATQAASKPKPRNADEKIVAALTEHHGYQDESCLNQTPVVQADLVRQGIAGKATVSDFFKKQFGSYDRYVAICRDTGELIAAIKLMRGEVTPKFLLRTLKD